MRLIDADELLKYMETTEISQSIDEINKGNDNYSSTALYGYIKEIHTAYDVDKVVEQLEVESERWKESGEKYEDKKELGVAEGLKRAVKIVKSGEVATVRSGGIAWK